MSNENLQQSGFLDVRAYDNVLNHVHLYTHELTGESEYNIDFRDYPDFDVYIIDFINVIPDADSDNLGMRFNNSGTARSSSNYKRACFYSTTSGLSGLNSGTSANRLYIKGNSDIGSGIAEHGVSGRTFVYSPWDATTRTTLRGNGVYTSTALELEQTDFTGFWSTAEENDGITLFFASANLESGFVVLQGIANANNP